MDLAVALGEQASRLGLHLTWENPRLHIRRDDWAATFNAQGWLDSAHSTQDIVVLAWMLVGVRLGLDKRIPAPKPQAPLHLRFRRAQLRRYHEAPSFHGDHLPLLLPEIAHHAFEHTSGTRAFCRQWILPGYQILIYEDIGKRREILTTEDQQQSTESDHDRWRKARTALFYDAYKLRPRHRHPVDGGELRIYESVDGMGGTRGLLLPEFDYDSAQDGGYFAIPNRDCFIIARPSSPDSAHKMLPALDRAVSDACMASDFPMSDTLFLLQRDKILIHREPVLDFRPLTPILLQGLESARQIYG